MLLRKSVFDKYPHRMPFIMEHYGYPFRDNVYEWWMDVMNASDQELGYDYTSTLNEDGDDPWHDKAETQSHDTSGSENVSETDLWIPALHLTYRDRNEIIDGEMLSDKHIYAAQALLQKQFPHVDGLQDSCLSQTGFEEVGRGGLQIHHTRGNHWVLSSSLRPGFVQLYDSLYSTIHSDLERQLAEVYSDMADNNTQALYVDIVPCQKQQGSQDCALFAIAWAYELCQGRDVTRKQFIQSEMRDHFIQCLEEGAFSSFPSVTLDPSYARRVRRGNPNIAIIDVEDYL